MWGGERRFDVNPAESDGQSSKSARQQSNHQPFASPQQRRKEKSRNGAATGKGQAYHGLRRDGWAIRTIVQGGVLQGIGQQSAAIEAVSPILIRGERQSGDEEIEKRCSETALFVKRIEK